MTRFAIRLTDETREERIESVVSFVGADDSGSFGILARRERFVTTLAWGLCTYRTSDGRRHYLASPGGVLSYDGLLLSIATRHYLRDDDYDAIAQRLRADIAVEESALQSMRHVLRRVDQELLRRLLAVSPTSGT